MRSMMTWAAFAVVLAVGVSRGQELETVAESSGYTRTSRYADVMSFCEGLAAASERVRLETLGESAEGRAIPVMWVGDPAVSSGAEAREAKKLVVLLIGNIHAGEVCGKEALLMLARDIALAEESPLLHDMVIGFVPIYNADGNERMGPDNRPGQVGPEEMGTRENGQGLDLNRDFVKLEAPETRALVKLLRDWDPEVIVDTHTTDGSHHRYQLTYAGPMHPAADQELVAYVRDTLLADVTKEVEKEYGWSTYFYGNFDREMTKWETYSAMPRYANQYRGLRNRVSILSEAYAYAPYKDRVLATRDFCRGVLSFAAAHKEEIQKLEREADRRAREAKVGEDVPIRTRISRTWEKVALKGYESGGRVEGEPTAPSGAEAEHVVDVYTSFDGSLSVARPWAYLIPADRANVVENLLRHGIKVEELREDVELEAEVYRLDRIDQSERAWQGHRLVSVETTGVPSTRRVPAGTLVVKTGQELGTLAVELLEPESEDGLAAWEFFGDAIAPGADYPVWRVGAETSLLTAPARELADEMKTGQRVTFDRLYTGRDRPDFDGSAVWGLSWEEDGTHYRQTIDGKRLSVQAATGRREVVDDGADLAEALGKLAWVEKEDVQRAVQRASFDDGRTGAIVTLNDDVYWVKADGSESRRLTAGHGAEEMATFSPDGRFVAYVRDNDLWVVDVATATESALTRGGTDTLRYGKHDWVYFEELYGRSWKAFWWSPDSTKLMLFETNASIMDDFTIVDDVAEDQHLETVRYPHPGERNPEVRVGVVSVGGGDIRWVDLSGYDDGAYLVAGAGFTPDGKNVWLEVQNRVQTWLDFLTAPAASGKTARLFRETTEAWVEPGGEPRWLEDGSFLWLSERTGWKHVYHMSADGTVLAQVTDGEYEVRGIERVDEKAGTLWFTGTVDSAVAQNLYRVALTGGEVTRLTNERGSHATSVSPTGEYFVDRWSSFDQTAKVALRNRDGAFVRWIDTNPVRDLERFDLGRREIVTIPGEDGAPGLEATITYPPGFDEGKSYPVWFTTYGGPHSPTVSDSWTGGFAWDQMLASAGIIAFHADPYSASGKGARSAWTAYRRLGEPEMADIERAITWLTANEWADASRVGMNGHSYGGFMTSYALTHSKLFSAGIAGAPVTDWRLYDSIYTERYMLTPQENPEGYEKTSVIGAAKDLHGRLLLLHGTMDDNVHMQNSIRLVDALERAEKMDFEMYLYPGFRHGIYGAHYRRTLWDYIRRTMGVEEAVDEEEGGSMADEEVGEVRGP